MNLSKRPGKVEKFQFYNNLVCILKSLEGKYTVIDLRNESTVTGRVKEVDGYWNTEMEDVTFYNPRGEEYTFDSFFINARNIRYVHVPEGFSTESLIQTEMFDRKPKKRERGNIFKKKRAEKYQQQVLQEAYSTEA